MPTLCFWATIRVYCFRQWSKFCFWSLWSRAYIRSCNQDTEFALFFFFFFHCFLLIYRCCVDNPLLLLLKFLFPSFRKPPKVSTYTEFGVHAGHVCQNFEFHSPLPYPWIIVIIMLFPLSGPLHLIKHFNTLFHLWN